jgi:hypothetical protein
MAKITTDGDDETYEARVNQADMDEEEPNERPSIDNITDRCDGEHEGTSCIRWCGCRGPRLLVFGAAAPAGAGCYMVNRLDTALHIITVLLHGLYVGVIAIWLHWHDQAVGRHGTARC